MKPDVRIAFIIAAAVSAASPRVTTAKPPEGIPPGQAKKEGQGPPAHAPAQGYRKKYQYKYWPDHEVYFDPSRSIYFFRDDNRWVESSRLPTRLRLNLGSGVSIELETPNPFDPHAAHRRP